MQAVDMTAAFSSFIADCGRLLGMIVVLYGAVIIILKKMVPAWMLFLAAGVVVIFELSHFDKKLIHPTPPQQINAYLQADDVVQFLKKDPEPFRIFPLTSGRNPD